MDKQNFKPTTVDEYIAGCEPEAQVILQQIRAIVHELAPQAQELISY